MTAQLAYPALHASHAGIWIATPDGEVREVAKGEAAARAAETPMILLNAPLTGQRLGYPDLSGLDLLELFAFIFPARFAVPTPHGFARALGLTPPRDEREAARTYLVAAQKLLAVLAAGDWPEREGAWTSAQSLYRLRWPWAAEVAGRIARPEQGERWLFSRLDEWEEAAPRPQP
ncbi:MAG: ATP-dependent DNA helicase, partial [Sphingomonadales bacterium]|nr:ATP-dependent DNA helicase [Sphingomonadales bacterium]